LRKPETSPPKNATGCPKNSLRIGFSSSIKMQKYS